MGKKMNERKAVFFDVDGTLFKQGKDVPKSTIRAIAKIRENGHLAFVCTGRSRVMVPKTPILDIGFDGVVAACGMYADYQGKLLFAEEMRQEVLDDILPVLQRTETMYILEGTEYIYYDENTIGNAIDDWYIDAIRTMIPGHFIPVPKNSCKIRASKVSIQVPPQRAHEVIEAAKKNFQILLHYDNIGEIVPKGYTKASGIRRVCELLGIDRADTIAVGDSINDVDMLQFAGCGIAMGNATEPAKEIADYVTTDIFEDGIWNAMAHMGLL